MNRASGRVWESLNNPSQRRLCLHGNARLTPLSTPRRRRASYVLQQLPRRHPRAMRSSPLHGTFSSTVDATALLRTLRLLDGDDDGGPEAVGAVLGPGDGLGRHPIDAPAASGSARGPSPLVRIAVMAKNSGQGSLVSTVAGERPGRVQSPTKSPQRLGMEPSETVTGSVAWGLAAEPIAGRWRERRLHRGGIPDAVRTRAGLSFAISRRALRGAEELLDGIQRQRRLPMGLKYRRPRCQPRREVAGGYAISEATKGETRARTREDRFWQERPVRSP